MSAVRVRPGRSINTMMTLIGLILVLYFAYHALAGSRGWFALVDLNRRHEALTEERDLVKAERVRFERRVDLLANDHLDPDLLEESARASLGFAHPDDLIIYRQP